MPGCGANRTENGFFVVSSSIAAKPVLAMPTAKLVAAVAARNDRREVVELRLWRGERRWRSNEKLFFISAVRFQMVEVIHSKVPTVSPTGKVARKFYQSLS